MLSILDHGNAHRQRQRNMGVVVAASIVVVALSGASCERKPAARAPRPVNASYLELVSLSPQPDATHQNRIQGPNNTVWYREKEPGLNLARCDFERTFADQCPDGTWEIVVPVQTPLGATLLAQWSSDRLERDAGVTLDGRLILIAKLKSTLHECIAIPAFATRKEAEAAAAAIRAGGVEP